jgi:hypothetical protein
VTVEVPLLALDVAVMVTVPAFLPVTSPEALTLAIGPSLDCQVNVALGTALPCASVADAVSCVVKPTLTDVDAGDTVTLATGPGVTVSVAPGETLPSLVAVIVEVPTTNPVATPEDETLATVGLLDAHVTTRPVTTTPLMSFVVAVKVDVDPLATVADNGATVTLPTGTSVTESDAVPAIPSLVAVTVTVPGAPPCATPVDEPIVATVGSLVDQATGRVTTVPLTSLRVAVKVVFVPTTIEILAGATVTVATGGAVTVTVELPDFVSLVAVIAVEPGATPVTTPVDDTVAMLVLADDHVTTRSVTTVPF